MDPDRCPYRFPVRVLLSGRPLVPWSIYGALIGVLIVPPVLGLWWSVGLVLALVVVGFRLSWERFPRIRVNRSNW